MTLIFSLGAFTEISVNFVAHCCITPFGVAVRGKATLKILLAWVIPYSGNTNVRYDIMFSFGPLILLLISNRDFGVKALPQTCQQSIFGILMATQIKPWGQTFWAS